MKHVFTCLLIFIGNLVFAQSDSTDLDFGGNDSLEFDSTPRAPIRGKHFFINGSAAYGEAYHRIESKKYPELIACRGDHETYIHVPTFDISMGYQFKNWFSLSVGAQYLETGFDFTASKQLDDSLALEFAIGCDVYQAVDPAMGFVWAAFYDPRFFSVIHADHPSYATQKIKIRYYHVGFPVKMEFTGLLAIARGGSARLQRSHFGWARVFLNTAIIPNYMIRQRHDISWQAGTWNYIYQDSMGIPEPFLRRWNLGASVAAGFTYRILDNLEARFECTAQFQLLDLFNWQLYGKFDYEEKYCILRPGISLTYFLPKD